MSNLPPPPPPLEFAVRARRNRGRTGLLCVGGLVALVFAGYIVLWMMAHQSSHTMKVTSVKGNRVCGMDLDGSGEPQGQPFCITPDFPNTHEVASHLAPGDCVLVTTGEGGPRLENEKPCPS